MNAVILCDVIAYLLVLVSGDGSEDRLREAEGLDSLPAGHRLVGRQFAAEVFPDDMNTRLILVHGVEDDLKIWKEIRWGGAANMAPVVSSDSAVCKCSSQSFRWNHFWRKLNSNPRAEHLLKNEKTPLQLFLTQLPVMYTAHTVYCSKYTACMHACVRLWVSVLVIRFPWFCLCENIWKIGRKFRKFVQIENSLSCCYCGQNQRPHFQFVWIFFVLFCSWYIRFCEGFICSCESLQGEFGDWRPSQV